MWTASSVHAQTNAPRHAEAGRPFFTCYGPDEFGASPQNWYFVQDDRGVVYIANNQGILEFDGAAWRLINFPGNFVRDMDRDDEGRL